RVDEPEVEVTDVARTLPQRASLQTATGMWDVETKPAGEFRRRGTLRARHANSPAGAGSRRHLRVRAERRDGGGQPAARYFRRAGPGVRRGKYRRHRPRPP